jgi:CRP-like cAMP-binding protein
VATDPIALLKGVPLFAELSDELLATLAPHLHRRGFRRGTMLFHKDQAGDALYIIESGRVRIFRPEEGGKELDIDQKGPRDVFGEMALLDGQPRSASVEAQEDTVVFTLSREEFQRALAASPPLAAAVIAMLSRTLRHLMDYAETLAFLDVPARVARVLLDLTARYGVKEDGGVRIGVAITQAELARMVGATRERVNRALASFRIQRLIAIRGRHVTVLDQQRLAQRIY